MNAVDFGAQLCLDHIEPTVTTGRNERIVSIISRAPERRPQEQCVALLRNCLHPLTAAERSGGLLNRYTVRQVSDPSATFARLNPAPRSRRSAPACATSPLARQGAPVPATRNVRHART